MTKTIKKTFAVIVMAIVALAMLMPAQIQNASAGAPQLINYSKKITLYKENDYMCLDMGKRANNSKEITATSSNRSVIKIYSTESTSGFVYLHLLKKKGKSTITVKIKKKSGTRTYKCKMNIVPYSSPAKSVKVGKKSFTKAFRNKNSEINYKPKKAKQKVIVKCKKGWKVKIHLCYYRKDFKDHYVRVKNGSKVTYRKNTMEQYLRFKFYNKSRNYTIERCIGIDYYNVGE